MSFTLIGGELQARQLAYLRVDLILMSTLVDTGWVCAGAYCCLLDSGTAIARSVAALCYG